MILPRALRAAPPTGLRRGDGAMNRRECLQALAAAAAVGAGFAPRDGVAAAAAAAADPPTVSRFFRTSDGVRLHVLERRPPRPGHSAPTIVLVPGWCMPASIWSHQLAAFGARWRTIAFDPRGQGRSEVPRGGYTADRRADDIADLLAQEERVVLVGWSLGVLDALQYVYRHGADRLAGLALVDNSIGEPPAPQGGGQFFQHLRQRREPTVDAFVRGMFHRTQPESEIDRLVRDALRMPLADSIALLSYPIARSHWRRIAEGFDRPLAYLVTPRLRAQSEHLQRARPASRIAVFEHAGHALFVDEAARFNHIVTTWVDTDITSSDRARA